jgi:hypothetical protein
MNSCETLNIHVLVFNHRKQHDHVKIKMGIDLLHYFVTHHIKSKVVH